MIFLLAGVFCAFLAAAIIWSPEPWRDDGDVSRMIQHSVRVPSELERVALWRGRYCLYLEHGDKFAARLALDPPPMRTVYP